MNFYWQSCFGDTLGPDNPFEPDESTAGPVPNHMGAWHPVQFQFVEDEDGDMSPVVLWRRCLQILDWDEFLHDQQAHVDADDD